MLHRTCCKWISQPMWGSSTYYNIYDIPRSLIFSSAFPCRSRSGHLGAMINMAPRSSSRVNCFPAISTKKKVGSRLIPTIAHRKQPTNLSTPARGFFSGLFAFSLSRITASHSVHSLAQPSGSFSTAMNVSTSIASGDDSVEYHRLPRSDSLRKDSEIAQKPSKGNLSLKTQTIIYGGYVSGKSTFKLYMA